MEPALLSKNGGDSCETNFSEAEIVEESVVRHNLVEQDWWPGRTLSSRNLSNRSGGRI